jgi:phosphoglycolate phosphatase-like HAD superfamily hydrolase
MTGIPHHIGHRRAASSPTMRGMRTLVLWDIDHTLVSIRGLSREIYGEVFHQVTGRRPDRIVDMAGRTDRAIISETLRLHGMAPTPEVMVTFTGALAEAFAARQDEIKARGRDLPGARAVLAALAGRTDVIQSVLTGNLRPIAVCKLTAFDLHTFVDFEVGAYGCDDTDRPPLVRLARQRAGRKYGEIFDAARTVLAGDTPHDVDAGHRGGARVVAVATGASDEETLRSAGAERVLADLTHTDGVVRAVLQVGAA